MSNYSDAYEFAVYIQYLHKSVEAWIDIGRRLKWHLNGIVNVISFTCPAKI